MLAAYVCMQALACLAYVCIYLHLHACVMFFWLYRIVNKKIHRRPIIPHLPCFESPPKSKKKGNENLGSQPPTALLLLLLFLGLGRQTTLRGCRIQHPVTLGGSAAGTFVSG